MQNKTARATPASPRQSAPRAEEHATLLLDQHGIVQHCSQRLIRLLGTQQRALKGQPLARFLPGFPMHPETPGYNRAFAAFWQDRGVWEQDAGEIEAPPPATETSAPDSAPNPGPNAAPNATPNPGGAVEAARGVPGDAASSPARRGKTAGSKRPGTVVEAVVRTLSPRDAQSEPLFLVGLRFTGRMVERCPAIERQNDELKAALQQLQHEGTHDSLTGLPNRGLFLDRLGQHLARGARHGTRFALACINLDGFRGINDRHGHAAGDALLQACARHLRASLRDEDTLGRLGGDEFGLILADLRSEDSLHAPLDKIRTALGQDIDYAGHPLRITATIGLSLYPEGGRDADSLMRQADRAMRRGKRDARGQICRGGAIDY